MPGCLAEASAHNASMAVPDGGDALLLSPLGSGDELEYLSSATLTRRKDFLEAEEEVCISLVSRFGGGSLPTHCLRT